MNYHPDVRLRHLHALIAGNYDGALSIGDNAEVVGRDGKSLGHQRGHVFVLRPDDPDYAAVARVLRRAHLDHYAEQGLRAPAADALPYHLQETPTP